MQHATCLLEQEVMDERAVTPHRLRPDTRLIGQQVRDREARAVLLALLQVSRLPKRILHFCQCRVPVLQDHLPEAREGEIGEYVLWAERKSGVTLPRETKDSVGPDSHPAVNHAGEMDTKEGQLRIRDWIDQAFDNAALAVGKPIVLAAKRHDLVLDPQTGNPGHPIGLQPRARDQASSGPGPPTGADRDTCFGLLDPIDLDPVLDLASSVDNHSADCLAYEPVVHDPGRGHKQCTHACDVRLARFQLGGVEFLYFNVVLNRTPVELLHTPRFDLVCGDQHLAADFERNAVLAAELLCRLRAACNYSPPHGDAFLLLNQQLTPISSRCRVESNCRRDVSRAASCDATLVVSSGTLLV